MDEMRVLTAYIDHPEQSTISVYEKNGGYQALKKALKEISPEQLRNEVERSELRGRGGAGFVTGKKWKFIPKDPSLPKYLICNCDESEPGTFKDRLLIEKDPHQLIEGVILASYAIEACQAFIYCRGEYFEGIVKLQKALDEAVGRGYVGKNILGSSFSLDIVIHPGAGAYIAGEETAQINSLEGFRATPRLKPPFPAVEGLYNKPTIVNNVETLCNVVHIVNRGADWFLSIGKEKNRGTKIFQVSGQVVRPGCFEFPLGTPLKRILEAAGGMLPGRTFKACYPGGSSCCLLTKEEMDLPMDFEALSSVGSALGTASIIVMDDSADMVKVSARLMAFYQNESCGKCTPCREGSRWLVQILDRIEAGKGRFEDLEVIEAVSKNMGVNSFCALGTTAILPLISAIKAFKSEFEAYILKNPDAKKTPRMKIVYPYT